jgi:hypothetical protein
MLRITLSTSTASLLAFTIYVGPAQAQSRVFVAAQGSDANPCTFALPCRTFQRAHNVVAANGEIDVLDPAGYGPVIINKAVSIQGHDFSGMTVPSGGDGITINAGPDDTVNLRGLIIEGAGSGQTGIRFNSGAFLSVQNCVIRNVSLYGIGFFPANDASLAVADTFIAKAANSGILVEPAVAGIALQAQLNRIAVNDALGTASGFAFVTFSASRITASVADSLAFRTGSGFVASGFTGSMSWC